MIDHQISKDLLQAAGEFLADQMGLNFPPERHVDLERGIREAAREFGYENAESCIRWLISSPLKKNQIEILASHLTVGETYFFREKQSFEILEEKILPEILASQKGQGWLRIWSAGCSTGEEAYSIAITLCRLLPNLKEWNVTLLATDINPRFLQKAREGVYGEWSFRNTPSWAKEQYFSKTTSGTYSILPRIREIVTFSYLNLAEDVYPSLFNNTNAMQIIFCRNALLYFAQEKASRVVNNFHRALVTGGWLFMSPAEASPSLMRRFERVAYSEAIVYRKEPEEALQSLKQMFPQTEILPATDERPLKKQMPVKPAKKTEKEEAAELEKQARSHADQGNITEALICCDRAISIEKLHPNLHYLRAMLLQESGQIEKAILALKQVLYLDPGYALAHFSLGLLSQKQDLTNESEKHLENALYFLGKYGPGEIIPESDGLTADRLKAVIETVRYPHDNDTGS